MYCLQEKIEGTLTMISALFLLLLAPVVIAVGALKWQFFLAIFREKRWVVAVAAAAAAVVGVGVVDYVNVNVSAAAAYVVVVSAVAVVVVHVACQVPPSSRIILQLP